MTKETFDFDNFSQTPKYKTFKFDYSNDMKSAMEINALECLVEGIKSGLYSSYEYISDGSVWVEPEGITASTNKFDICIKPKGCVDIDKGYFRPDQLEIEIAY